MMAVSLSVPGSPDGQREVREAFDAFGASNGIPPSVAQAVQVSLDEILSNTVRSGFTPGRAGHIDVRFEITGDALDVHIVDDGLAFDPLTRPDPNTGAPLEDRPVGGLGIYLVRQLMDGVEYERRDGKNRLRLRKRIIRG